MNKNIIITILIIINLVLIGIIYNFISKENVNNKKQIIKEMTETEYEDNIKSLNSSHEEYANYIEESKEKIASAITDMGVTTSDEETLETMASNIRNIARDASSISYNNTSSQLTSTNVQGAVDELNNSLNYYLPIFKHIGVVNSIAIPKPFANAQVCRITIGYSGGYAGLVDGIGEYIIDYNANKVYPLIESSLVTNKAVANNHASFFFNTETFISYCIEVLKVR